MTSNWQKACTTSSLFSHTTHIFAVIKSYTHRSRHMPSRRHCISALPLKRLDSWLPTPVNHLVYQNDNAVRTYGNLSHQHVWQWMYQGVDNSPFQTLSRIHILSWPFGWCCDYIFVQPKSQTHLVKTWKKKFDIFCTLSNQIAPWRKHNFVLLQENRGSRIPLKTNLKYIHCWRMQWHHILDHSTHWLMVKMVGC